MNLSSVVLSLRLCRQTFEGSAPAATAHQHTASPASSAVAAANAASRYPSISICRLAWPRSAVEYGPWRLDSAGPGGWSQGLVAYDRPSSPCRCV